MDTAKIVSNSFTLEWPKHSGIIKKFPEIDRGQWFDVAEALIKIQKGQEEFIDRLMERLRVHTSGKIPLHGYDERNR